MSDSGIQVPVGLTTEGLVGRRYIARIIDSMILAAVVGGVVLASAVFGTRGTVAGVRIYLLVFLLAIWIGYGTFLESSAWQATLGKKLMGLRTFNETGGRLSANQAATRNLIKDGPFFVIQFLPGGQLLNMILLIAHVVVLQRSSVSQAIHDRIAHTWVAAPTETTSLNLNAY